MNKDTAALALAAFLQESFEAFFQKGGRGEGLGPMKAGDAVTAAL
ncbi:MAG: hypothetical protein AAF492_04315 [Verrucomicrobiota bacterium]